LQPIDAHHERKSPRRNHASAELREHTLLELAKRDTTDFLATCRAVTEAAAVLVGVDRASVWHFDGPKLVCDDLFLRDDARHASGQAILLSSCPTYFASISQSLVVRARDAHTDVRTRELEDSYLRPLGIGAMLDTPIWHPGGMWGILCCEHVGGPRRWTEREERLAARMADLVARSLETSTRRAAEERSKIILEAIPQYVLVVDDQGAVIEASAAATRTMAAVGGIALAARFESLELHNLAGESIPQSQWPTERARRGETVRGEIVEIHSRVTGQSRWLRATSAPVRIGGNIHGAVVIYEDVAEEIRIERVKREMLSAVAHELRTPATIAKGYAQRLQRAHGRTQDEWRALSAIERATDRIARLAEDLVDLSAITLGRIILSMEHADLTELALRAVEGAQGARTHLVRFVPYRTPVPVFGDPMRIRRVIGELVENAARCSSAGSEIEVELREDDGSAKVFVRDHGVGIPEIAQGRIFEPFFRAHAGTPSDVGGLGIGLFLAREIVARHGGSMSFESKEGVGSTFVVSLPIDEEAE